MRRRCCLTTLTFVLTLTWVKAAPPQLERRVPHTEHEIPEDQIIDLPIGRFPEPICEYSVHWNGLNGPKVDGTVRVGDPLYHKWHCSYPGLTLNLYCIMVQKCTVSNGSGRSVRILDKNGCTLFPSIVPHVEYPYKDDLVAGLATHAFAMEIDSPAIFFNCSIRLLIKQRGKCPRPVCPRVVKPRH